MAPEEFSLYSQIFTPASISSVFYNIFYYPIAIDKLVNVCHFISFSPIWPKYTQYFISSHPPLSVGYFTNKIKYFHILPHYQPGTSPAVIQCSFLFRWWSHLHKWRFLANKPIRLGKSYFFTVYVKKIVVPHLLYIRLFICPIHVY